MDREVSEKEIKEKLVHCGQEHFCKFLEVIPHAEKKVLCNDLKSIDFQEVSELYQLYKTAQTVEPEKKVFQQADVLSFEHGGAALPSSKVLYALGEDYLREGKVAIFLVAGGQGTRLGFEGPKGCYPVSPAQRKSLFQMFAERILALQRRYGSRLFWYIMTSSANHTETKKFFQQHKFFGLTSDQLKFFVQGEIPSLDLTGKLILGLNKRVFKNPNGHGGSIKALHSSGALEDMAAKGLEEIFYFQVDNPLAKIADPLFIGAHVEHKAQMSTKVVKKVDPAERVGIIGKINGRLGCIEYSELSPEELRLQKEDGSLRFNSANIAIHMIKRSFVEDVVSNKDFGLPYHIAVKEIACLAAQRDTFIPRKIKGLKFEMFIFDALRYTQNSVTLEVERPEEFAPVKNKHGVDSPETAKRALIDLYKRWLKNSGKAPSYPNDLVIEISPLYALDEAEFHQKFKAQLPLTSPLYLGP